MWLFLALLVSHLVALVAGGFLEYRFGRRAQDIADAAATKAVQIARAAKG